jgi:hypothetical protein
MRGSSPRMTRELRALRPRLCSAPLRKSYALRCVRGTTTLLASLLRFAYFERFERDKRTADLRSSLRRLS